MVDNGCDSAILGIYFVSQKRIDFQFFKVMNTI
jgi:tRNA A22 N-methylase